MMFKGRAVHARREESFGHKPEIGLIQPAFVVDSGAMGDTNTIRLHGR